VDTAFFVGEAIQIPFMTYFFEVGGTLLILLGGLFVGSLVFSLFLILLFGLR